MEGKRHLNEEQRNSFALGDGSADAAAHLADCAECTEEMQRLRAALAGLAKEVQAETERPESFWARQQRGIADRIAGTTTTAHRLAWATAFAIVMLLAGTFVHQAPVEQARPYDPDDELLRQVARSMRREAPVALEPAGLLASEMNRAAEAGARPQKNPNDERR